jgi:hypothetical protein
MKAEKWKALLSQKGFLKGNQILALSDWSVSISFHGGASAAARESSPLWFTDTFIYQEANGFVYYHLWEDINSITFIPNPLLQNRR